MDDGLALLLSARSIGITIRADGENLALRGNLEAPLAAGAVEAIKANKHVVLNTIRALPGRLRQGQTWLVAAHKQLGEGASRADTETFGDRLDLWDKLDGLIVPRVCPIGPGGCDEQAPVICRSCGEE